MEHRLAPGNYDADKQFFHPEGDGLEAFLDELETEFRAGDIDPGETDASVLHNYEEGLWIYDSSSKRRNGGFRAVVTDDYAGWEIAGDRVDPRDIEMYASVIQSVRRSGYEECRDLLQVGQADASVLEEFTDQDQDYLGSHEFQRAVTD